MRRVLVSLGRKIKNKKCHHGNRLSAWVWIFVSVYLGVRLATDNKMASYVLKITDTILASLLNQSAKLGNGRSAHLAHRRKGRHSEQSQTRGQMETSTEMKVCTWNHSDKYNRPYRYIHIVKHLHTFLGVLLKCTLTPSDMRLLSVLQFTNTMRM